MGRKRNDPVEEIKEKLRRKPAPVLEEGLLSSGSTLLNLACTGKREGAYQKGRYYNYIGASNSGKSWMVLTTFAEASINPEFDNYRLIYDNPENSLTMDVERYFGKKMASRLELAFSPSVEGFYYGMDDCFKAKQPFIYVLDSMDSLNPEDDTEKFQEKKTAYNKKRLTGKAADTSGSYGTAKAKANSNGLRLLMDPLRETGSILIIISQSRKNIGFGAQFNPDVQSGGTALKFYATLQMWTTVKELIKKRVAGKDRQIGIRTKIHVKKNRLTGRDRAVNLPIYHSTGLGEVDSCVDWLIDEKHWKGTIDTVEAPEFGFSGDKEELICKIHSDGEEDKLAALVEERWNAIERACHVERKSKYHEPD